MSMKPCYQLLVVLVVTLALLGAAQASDEIRLIVRGDDIGSSHAANIGCIESYKSGIMRSVEVMVPCAWFEEAVAMLNANPGLDAGIHLTLTSEWEKIKWRPLTHGPSLTDANGYFYPTTREWDKWPAGTGFYDANPKLAEVEAELRAQIELALERINNVSHVTCHMGTARCRKDLAAMVDRLTKEYGLEVDLASHNIKSARGMGDSKASPEDRAQALAQTLEKLTPGLWLFVEHPSKDFPEMRAIGHKGYEHVANDREGVTQAFTSDQVKEVIKRRKIKLMSYGDFRKKAN
jgi:chitin disaccharide deacetylase